jgi:glutamate/tyrosine decarboxylase-like PLP-dependent enzyme
MDVWKDDSSRVIFVDATFSSFHKTGLLDICYRFYFDLQSELLMRITKMTDVWIFHEMLSFLFLFLNDIMGIFLIHSLIQFMQTLRRTSIIELKDDFVQKSFELAKEYVPMVKRELIKEEAKLEADLKKKMWKNRTIVTKILPKEGANSELVLESLKARVSKENSKWNEGKVSGAVYSGENFLTMLHKQVFGLYSLSNPLHVDIWPSICQCEAEVISMTVNLLNGGDSEICGAVTSGGTESIVLSVRAHLQEYGVKRGIKYPEIIAGDTAHAGLDKACDMFHIRLIKIPCDERTGYQLDYKEVEKRMSSDVIMIYASAPSYPQGVIDPIEYLGKIATKYNVGFHVDACLGGFILPFARMMDYDIPKFDFECAGVTSMSADTHKYGYACKGTSVILYRNKILRRAQYFSYAKWTGGIYGTPTIAGSRNGALIVCAWTSLVALGEEGFKQRSKMILEATKEIALGIEKIKGVRALGGHPKAMVCCFASDNENLDIYEVGDEMSELGWSLNSLQNPASIHICVTLSTVPHITKFLQDLEKSVIKCARHKEGKRHNGGTAAMYGMTGTLPKGPVNELVNAYTDINLSC